ncbi:unnamed protein product, partial [Medioppia subpectinata]
ENLVSDKRIIKITLLFICLHLNQNLVASQRYANRNNRPLSRSLSDSNKDQTILKVYPSGQYGPQDKTYEDAGVPPRVKPYMPPDIPPQEDTVYDSKPTQVDSKADEETKSSADDNIGANGCICVPYYQCDDGNIITDGSGIIDPRKIKPSEKEIP